MKPLKKNGVLQRHFVALIKKVKDVLNHINADSASSQTSAREIMGKNFFGIEEAIKYFGINPSGSQIASLSEVPFSNKTLTACKDTHVLVAVFPLSIVDLRSKVADNKQTLFSKPDWYEKQTFANDKEETVWELIRRESVAKSAYMAWPEQKKLLSEHEEASRARVLIYSIIGIFLSTSERLFEKAYVRCADTLSGGGRVFIRFSASNGLEIQAFDENFANSNISISSAVKKLCTS